MFFNKSRDIEDQELGINERLLGVGEGGLWTESEESYRCTSVAVTLLHFTILGIIFLVGVLFGFFFRGDLDGVCSDYVSQYSPITKEVGIAYSSQKFNGTLLQENIFRQDPGPEVDEAWESLGVNYRAVRVAPEQASESGLTSDQVKINEKYGGGFPANVEGLHHLHCLNVVRQALYYNYDYYHSRKGGAFINNDLIARRQVSHCLDVLRQQLMCTVDTGVIGQVWIYPENPEPFVDLNTNHKCKNFDEIRDWAKANQLPEDPPIDFLQPPASKEGVLKRMP